MSNQEIMNIRVSQYVKTLLATRNSSLSSVFLQEYDAKGRVIFENSA